MTQFRQTGFPIPSLRERLTYAGLFVARDPMLAPELAWKFVRRKLFDGRHASRTAEYSQFQADTVVAIARMVNQPTSRVAEVLNEDPLRELQAELEARRIQIGLINRSFAGFGELCYAICRLNKPKVVVETGVAFGWTSAFMLQALEVNNVGTLHSIDLPPFRADSDRIVGAIVPDRLLPAWNLHKGSQRRILPRLLKDLGDVDFVHYDSDKTYHGMMWAYGMLWDHLSADSVFVSDDIWNDAFLDFADGEGRSPIVIETTRSRGRLALLRK